MAPKSGWVSKPLSATEEKIPELQPPRPATGVSRALQARSVPEGVPENGGVQESVRRGVSGTLWAPGSGVSRKCPESVPGVSKRCPEHSGDTLGTPFGHSGARGRKGPGDTPSDTLSDTPVSGTPSGTLSGHFGPEGPGETPVAGRGGLQYLS